MKNKKQIKTQIENNNAIFRTIRLLGKNKKLQKALEQEFIKMVQETQFNIKYSLNDREEANSDFNFIDIEVGNYISAFKVHCKIVKILGGC